jgi:hypothetical protein
MFRRRTDPVPTAEEQEQADEIVSLLTEATVRSEELHQQLELLRILVEAEMEQP